MSMLPCWESCWSQQISALHRAHHAMHGNSLWKLLHNFSLQGGVTNAYHQHNLRIW